MIAITNSLERHRAAARRDRLIEIETHVVALIEAVDCPNDDPLLMDAGRYVSAVLEEFDNDLLIERETLLRAIAAWDASWGERGQ